MASKMTALFLFFKLHHNKNLNWLRKNISNILYYNIIFFLKALLETILLALFELMEFILDMLGA